MNQSKNYILNSCYRHKLLTVLIIFAVVAPIYIYKCYTDPLYYKTELYDTDGKRGQVLSKILPDGMSRQEAEKILIYSDGARIELNDPPSGNVVAKSVIYNLDPWTLFSNDAAYVYIWYDQNNKITGLDGTYLNGKRNPKNRGMK